MAWRVRSSSPAPDHSTCLRLKQLSEESMPVLLHSSTLEDRLNQRDISDPSASSALITSEQRIRLSTYARLLPAAQARRHETIVLGQGDDTYQVLMTEPGNGARIGWISRILKVPPKLIADFANQPTAIRAAFWRRLRPSSHPANGRQPGAPPRRLQ